MILLIVFAFVALVEYYNAKIETLAEFISNPPPQDCCMCGSDVNSHGWGDGHRAMSMYDYYSQDIVKGITIKRTPSAPLPEIPFDLPIDLKLMKPNVGFNYNTI